VYEPSAAACKPPRRLLRGQLDSWESSGGFNHPKVLNAELPQKPSPLEDDDPTIFRYRAGALGVGNDVFVADLTLKQATDYCGSPLLRASIGFTYHCEEDFPMCVPDPLPPPQPQPQLQYAPLTALGRAPTQQAQPEAALLLQVDRPRPGPAAPRAAREMAHIHSQLQVHHSKVRKSPLSVSPQRERL